MTRLELTDDEGDLIVTLRRHVEEIEALSQQSEEERVAWEAEHPGEFYSALAIDGSAGGKAYSQCAEAMAEMAEKAFDLAARTLGVTGWQASYAQLEFLRRSRDIEGPFGIYTMSDALYPQYDLFERLEKMRRDPVTVKWLGDCAEYALATKDSAAERVRDHWRWLVAERDELTGVLSDS